MQTGIQILSSGLYVPDFSVDNEAFTEFVETSDEWITTRTGIRSRHLSTGEPTWYMGAMAADQALKNAGLSPQDVDMVLVSTVTADYATPSMACMIQKHLEIKNAVCMDVNGACTGFIYVLDIAHKYLVTDSVKHILIVSCERLSKITDYTDRSTCVLFGDGAGACVVKKGDKQFASFLSSDGRGAGLLYARSADQYNNPLVPEWNPAPYDPMLTSAPETLVMDGKEVYKFATRVMCESLKKACEKAGISVEALKYIIPHQANIRIVETAATKLKVGMDKMYVNIDRFANTSSASIPIAFAELSRTGVLKSGDKIAFVGFGAGLTCGAAIVEL